MHLIFREAKEEQHVTVLLSGEGADEVFGGYEWYSVAHKRERLRRMPMLGVVSGLVPGRKGAVLRKVLDPDYLLAANATFPPAEVRGLGLAGADPLAVRRQLWPESSRGIGRPVRVRPAHLSAAALAAPGSHEHGRRPRGARAVPRSLPGRVGERLARDGEGP